MNQSDSVLAIVGGGAAGVATFIAAVRNRAADVIYVIDPKPVGRGFAFSNSDDDILCNTSVDIMSVIDGKDSDFYDYLTSRGHDVSLDSYVPRPWFGDYLTDRYDQYRRIALRQGIDVVHLRYRFKSLKIVGRQRYRLRFEEDFSPVSLEATDIVFCVGFGAAQIPTALQPYRHHSAFVDCPYPESDLVNRVPHHSSVLVVGSKLSAVDAAIMLCRDGRKVTMISPSGDLLCVRSRFVRIRSHALDADAIRAITATTSPRSARTDVHIRYRWMRYLTKTLAAVSSLPWRSQFSDRPSVKERLLDEIEIAESGRNEWQDYVVPFVDALNEAAVKNGGTTLDEFNSLKKIIYRYVTGLALPNAKRIATLFERGVLTLRKGVLTRVVHEGDHGRWKVDWGEGEHNFDTIVSAAGYHFPNFVLNNDDEIEIDVYGGASPNTIGVSPELAAEHPRLSQESIWFVGPAAHLRMPLPNAVFIIAPVANAVIASLMKMSMKRPLRLISSRTEKASVADRNALSAQRVDLADID